MARRNKPRNPSRGATLVGARVQVKHGFLWLRRGEGTVRSTYEKEGRHFATVELDGKGKMLLRLVSTLRLVEKG